MHYTLGTAAKATGKSKPTIQRAIKSGKISAVKGVNGDWEIQPVELHRLFPAVTADTLSDTVTVDTDTSDGVTHIASLQIKLEAALQRVTDKEEQANEARAERDHWRHQATYLLEDKGKKEATIEEQREAQRRLSEEAIRRQLEQEQLQKSLQEAQAQLEKVRGSWLGRMIFKV